jgi:hypothetical protein
MVPVVDILFEPLTDPNKGPDKVVPLIVAPVILFDPAIAPYMVEALTVFEPATRP